MLQVHGTFQGRTLDSAFVVRFDLDGTDIGGEPVVSGDAYNNNVELANYVASFYSTTVHQDDQTIIAELRFAGLPQTASLNCQKQEAGPLVAKLIVRNEFGGVAATYNFVLEKQSDSFRQIDVEVDLVRGTDEPTEHRLGELRVTVEDCFARAGVALSHGQNRTVIDPTEGHEDARWSPAELNAAMHAHFHGFQADQVSWRIYMLIATRYLDDNTTGIMFDTFGRHRQGVAVFHTSRRAASSSETFQRDYIRTAVHELGHALNLLHSFDSRKRFGRGRRALSFMNYPHKFAHGTSAYWRDFGYVFEPEEVLFLRHGGLLSVIPGGHPYSTGGHDTVADLERLLPTCNAPGFRLELRVRRATEEVDQSRDLYHFAFGEPVHVEAKLANVSGEERQVEDALHPSHGEATYLIKKPNGVIVEHMPTMRRCSAARKVVLHPDLRSAIYEDIDLGYGAGGFNFVEPGRYEIQCVMRFEGRSLVSNSLPIWVNYPSKVEERHLAPSFDDRVGLYLTLWGAESVYLKKAQDILDSIADREEFRAHPLLDWYRLCQGCTAVHGFKTIDTDGVVKQVVEPTRNGKAVRAALGVSSRAHKRQRRIHLSHLIVSRLWGWLVEGAAKDNSNALIAKRLAGAAEDLNEFSVPDWAMSNLVKKWGVEDVWESHSSERTT